MRKTGIPILSVCLLLVAATVASGQEVKKFEFSGVERIQVDGVSGDFVIRPAEGGTGTVELRQDVTPAGVFEGEVEQRGSTLVIKEKWEGRNTRGNVEWIIYLPETRQPPRISIDTASGDLECERVSALFMFDTASGDIDLNDVKLVEGSEFDTASGDIELSQMSVEANSKFDTASGDVRLTDVTVGNGCRFDTASGEVILDGVTVGEGCSFDTASGDVRAQGCSGALELDTASGDVYIRDCTLTGSSKFASASGEVRVILGSLPEHDLSASSASGDVALEVGDFGRNFTLVLIKRKDRGRITCPFDFTSEDEFEEHGRTYVKKVVKRGSGGPEITLRTASGDLVVRER